MGQDKLYIEKELSWLSFNERVLQEAADSAARRIAAAGHAEEAILRDVEEKIGTIE